MINISYFLENGLPLDSGIEINKFTIQSNDNNEFSIKISIANNEILAKLIEVFEDGKESVFTKIDKLNNEFDLWVFFHNEYIVVSSIPKEYIEYQNNIYLDIYSSDNVFKLAILTKIK